MTKSMGKKVTCRGRWGRNLRQVMAVKPVNTTKKAKKEESQCNQCSKAQHDQSDDDQESSSSSSDYATDSSESSEQPKRGKKKMVASKTCKRSESRRSGKVDVPESSSSKKKKIGRTEVKIADPKFEISAGDRVRNKGLVIYTQKQRARNRPSNVICRVDAWSKMINELDETRVMAVKGMGFGGLLEIKLNFLPRQLCYWLMSRIVRDALVIGDMEFPLCPIQVNCVLGLPTGPLQVPHVEGVGEATPELVDVVVIRYGTLQENIDEDGNVRSIVKICIDDAMNDVEGPRVENGVAVPLGSDDDIQKFQTTFLVAALGMILCPTTDGSVLATSLLPAVTVASNARIYDWCKFVLDWLLDYAKMFLKRFNAKGYAGGCGGCTLFLAVISYLYNKYSNSILLCINILYWCANILLGSLEKTTS
ncbi:uncharacterized protein LOC110693632 [Chenopodium quinoa]|uniref:uncharacterized protein LOC110693632 n=1 Tax=Chenopodium quinoa TaxID=63459 RepID=UPI000B787737|nr:uncharacterized protein LOC110693632 [Chenopodium quinoa]